MTDLTYAQCQNCGISIDSDFIVSDLGYVPNVNVLIPIGQEHLPIKSYSMRIAECFNCHLVQMIDIPDMDEVFRDDYPYRSSMTKELVDHFTKLADNIILPHFKDMDNFSMVDIGANDGTLLDCVYKALYEKYLKRSSGLYGIEPCKFPIDDSNKDKHTIINAPCSKESAKQILEENVQYPSVITACNVFAHFADIDNFCEGVRLLMGRQTKLIVEVASIEDVVKNAYFDTFYTEHLRHFSAYSLANFLSSHIGVHIHEIQHVDTHGGSIRMIAMIEPPEHELQIDYEPLDWNTFNEAACFAKVSITNDVLDRILAVNGKIWAIGAPSRGAALLSMCGLNETYIKAVAEKAGHPKIGHYMPGTRIPIRPQSEMLEDNPEWILMLSHHLGESLILRMKEQGYKGGFIVPFRHDLNFRCV